MIDLLAWVPVGFCAVCAVLAQIDSFLWKRQQRKQRETVRRFLAEHKNGANAIEAVNRSQ